MSQAGGSIIGGGSGFLNTLTGNTGGAVGHFLNNINVVGDGSTITISGDPVTHTLTASVVLNAFVHSLTADVGGAATPTANNINILGGTNVTTTRVGSTITISSSAGAFAPTYVNVNASPYVVLLTDNYISVDTSAIAITIQLPNAPTINQYWVIKDRIGNAATRNITVTTVGGLILIDGNVNYIMNTDYQAINVLFNGVSYEVF